jgi:GT2 family glycosyltransferase
MLNILILNWNSTEAVKDCITAITGSDIKSYRIIMINNYSHDEDLNEMRKIKRHFGMKIEISLIENEKNLGYAGGNNSGINFLQKNDLQGDILILNPDIRVSPDTISQMQKALNTNVGIVSVRTLSPDGKILFDAIKLNGFFQRRIISDQHSINTDYSQGSCMLIKREIISQAGLFDERFFLYWEEVDFSLRVKNTGQKLIAITTTSIIKNENSEALKPGVFYYSVRNARLIREKHPDQFSFSGYILYLFWMALISLKYIYKPAVFIKIASYYLTGIADSFNNRYYAKLKY